MGRNTSFTILIALFLASCTKAEIPTTPTSTSILIPSPTPIEIPATPTEVAEPFLKEPLAQELSHTGEAYGVPQTFVVRVTKSMVPGPTARKGATEEKGLIKGEIGYSPSVKEDKLDYDNLDWEGTIPKNKVTKAIAWKKYMWWKTNATDEQRQAVKTTIGKDVEAISVEEYWSMVQEGNNADLVAIPIYGYNPETKKVEWNMVNPNAAVAVRFTDVDNTKLMTVYKNGSDSYAADAYGAVMHNNEIEILIKIGERYELNGLTITPRMIYGLNRLGYSLADQQPGEKSVIDYDIDSENSNFDPTFWKILIIRDGVDIGPFFIQ